MTNPDRTEELVTAPYEHRHLTPEQVDELQWLIDEAHDGDDRCGCLKLAIWALIAHDDVRALEHVRNCIAEHPAGLGVRAALKAQWIDW